MLEQEFQESFAPKCCDVQENHKVWHLQVLSISLARGLYFLYEEEKYVHPMSTL